MKSVKRFSAVILLSSLQYPDGPLDSYLFPTIRKEIISEAYENDIFIWDDFIDVLAPGYQPDIFYKMQTNRTKQPYIPFTQEEVNWVIKHQKEIKVAFYHILTKQLLTLRQFSAARKAIELLSKTDKEDYSIYLDENCPNCILLKHFKIQLTDAEYSDQKSSNSRTVQTDIRRLNAIGGLYA